MGAECIGARLKDDSAVVPSVPPGFAQLTSFTLQRIHDDVKPSACPDSRQNQMDIECSDSSEKFKKSLRHRPWVNYRQFDDNSEEEESDLEFLEQNVPSIPFLPKGVLRGCDECRNCQKVIAKWRPKDACRPVLDEAPVFYPTEEEFKDTLKYIASIRPIAEPYGICRIVPPPSWNPPCPLKEKNKWENSKFVTRIQQVDKLQNRESVKKLYRNHSIMKRKRRKLLKMGSEFTNSSNKNIMETNELGHYNNVERFGFEPGPEFTLESFQKYADDFKEQYFHIENMDIDLRSRQWEPSVENIEGEYWRMVERPTEEIEILYGADLATGVFGSGFPKRSSTLVNSDLEDQYVKSGWNLNNLPRLPGSVLSFESGDISGVLVPWLYIGMCFSSFCWHVEDHHLYSLNYLHWGAPKMWYGVPGRDALKLEGAMKKHLAELFEEQPDLLHNLVTQFSPSMLKLDGLPVYRCIQHSGEFVLTFPRAYHSGFNCGFNCAEAVNVAPVDWLPHGQNAVELYHEQERKISISHDKLLLGAARAAVKAQWDILFLQESSLANSRWKDACGVDGILAKALKARTEMERGRREYLCCSSQTRKMDASFDSNCEKECFVCHYDLHLSAAGCPCSPDKFACLVHAKQLCSCSWKTRFFLFRYEISEMNLLLDAVGGKLSAVHKWGLSDLGLSLSSYVTRDKNQEYKTSSEGAKQENETVKQDRLTGGARSYGLSQETKPSSLEVPKDRENISVNAVYSACSITEDDLSSVQCQTNPLTLSTLKEPQVQGSSSLKIMENQHLLFTTGKNVTDLCSSGSSSQKPSREGNVVPKVSPSLSSGKGNVILIDDDEDEGPFDLLSCKTNEEPSVENLETLARLNNCNDKVTSCNSHQDRVLLTPATSASAMSDKYLDLQHVMENSGSLSNLVPAKVEVEKNDHSILPDQQLLEFVPQRTLNMMNSASIPVAKPVSELAVKESDDNNIRSIRSHLQPPQLSGDGKLNVESKDSNIESDSNNNLMNSGKSITASSSSTSSSIDRCNLPMKGPRMAKVVRRLNCNVEPLEYGVVLPGKLWSTSQAIFPKGYRSRVRYLSILDPTQMCYYVSEILDAGLLGPLFMVVSEQSPTEVFFHVSPTKCWDMVREKVTNEIRRQRSIGVVNLPLQPPGPLDGLEMFGLSSPKIIQAIEARDQKRLCTDYWKSRHQPLITSIPSSRNSSPSPDKSQGSEGQCLLPGTNASLGTLFKKANLKELLALQSILRNDLHDTKQELVQLLNKEIDSRSE